MIANPDFREFGGSNPAPPLPADPLAIGPSPPAGRETRPGERRHETGAVRSTDVDHLHYTSISPIALRRLAAVHAEGDDRYGRFNWESGFAVDDLLNHAIPHIFKYLEGDRSEDHLGHALWNLAAATHSEELWPHLNEGRLRGPGCTPPAKANNPETPEVP